MGDLNHSNNPFESDELLGIDNFLEIISDCLRKCDDYENNLKQKEDLQKKILTGLSWGNQARKRLSEEIDDLTKSNKVIQQDLRKVIISGYNHHFESKEDETIKQTQISALAERFQKLLLKTSENETKFNQECNDKLINSIRILGVQLSEEEIQHKLSNNEFDNILASAIHREEKQLREVTDRNDNLKKLEADISELLDLYKEMMELVETQGVIVNKVETKIDMSEHDINRGTKRLKSAREQFEKVMSNKRWMALICGVLVILLLIIIILSRSATGASQDTSPSPSQDYYNYEEEYEDYHHYSSACDPLQDPNCIG